MALKLRLSQKNKDTNLLTNNDLRYLLKGFSIEVMPKTASKITNFNSILPKGTNVYIAHLEGTLISEMIETSRTLKQSGFNPIPHFPARIIPNKSTLEDWTNKYSSIGVNKALLLAGSPKKQLGDYSNSMELLSTGLFDKHRFSEIFCAGHPEGNKDIDPDGSEENLMEALKWKQDFSKSTKIKISITTQFCFDVKPIIEWEKRLSLAKIDLPINIGIAGPAKLQTMIKYAILCGVGPSIKILEKRAKDLTKLILPYTPKNFLTEIGNYKKVNKKTKIRSLHFFPLGGILNTTNFLNEIKRENSI